MEQKTKHLHVHLCVFWGEDAYWHLIISAKSSLPRLLVVCTSVCSGNRLLVVCTSVCSGSRRGPRAWCVAPARPQPQQCRGGAEPLRSLTVSECPLSHGRNETINSCYAYFMFLLESHEIIYVKMLCKLRKSYTSQMLFWFFLLI